MITEPFTFGIPLIARAAAADWPLVEALLALTLRSLAGQDDRNVRVRCTAPSSAFDPACGPAPVTTVPTSMPL